MDRAASSHWTDGEAYEAFIGRWSRVAAVEFIEWLGAPPQSTWLDVGCGTGALSQTILAHCDPARVDAFDLSPAFVDFARQTTADERASFRVADASELPAATDSFDVVVSALMLNIVENQESVLSELVRSVRREGTVGVYVWDFDGEMQLLRYFWNAANALDPAADRDRAASGFAICNPDRLGKALRDAGLHDVEVCAIDAPTRFRDFADYWTPFLRGNAASQSHARLLSDDKRAALRDNIRASLPIAADGSIPLIARAWAAKGTK